MAAKKTAKKSAEAAPPEVVKSPAPAAKKTATKAAKKAATKAAPEKAATTPAPAKVAPAKVVAAPSIDAIAKAAYLNYRRRVEQGLPGDRDGDWLEAERQLGATTTK